MDKLPLFRNIQEVCNYIDAEARKRLQKMVEAKNESAVY